MMRRPPPRMAGFTLVEAIITMVIIGVIGGMVSMFIRVPFEGYADSVARAELSDTADQALRRMARDLRLALPNSLRISADGRVLTFMLTKTAGRYLSSTDTVGTGKPLDFVNAANTDFDVVGTMSAGRQKIVAGDYVVVYNMGEDYPPADAYSGGNRALIQAVAGNRITMASNPFAVQAVQMTSPGNRFHVVRQAVSYVCDAVAGGAGTLRRFASDAAADPVGAGSSALMARNVAACTWRYEQLANVHSGLVGLTLELARAGSAARLVHQVHLDNTP